MYYSDLDNWTCEERGQGFVEAIKRAGYACAWLRWHQSRAGRAPRAQWTRKRRWLVSELKRTRKPLGLFASSPSQFRESVLH